MNKRVVIIFILLLSSIITFAQNKSDYTWLFANEFDTSMEGVEGSVVDFTTGKRETYEFASAMGLDLTNAMICDRETGRILFYTNGCAIADSTHNIMLNGENINPGNVHDSWCYDFDSFPQGNAAMIVDDPAVSSGYYMLHQNVIVDSLGISQLSFLMSYIDMEGNDGLGEVTIKNEELLPFGSVTGGYTTACKHANGKDWWIIQLSLESNHFYKFLVTSNGVSLDHEQFIGDQFDITLNSGHASFSSQGTQFSWFNPYDGLHLYDFDRSTGMFSNYRNVLDLPVEAGYTDYNGATRFSPSGQFLYASTCWHIFQIDTWATDIENAVIEIAEFDGFGDPLPVGFTSSLLGPDCRIYFASGAGTRHLGIMHYPDRPGLECMMVQHEMELPNYKSRGRIPNYPNFRIDEDQVCDSGITNNIDLEIPRVSTSIEISPNPVRDRMVLSFSKPLDAQGILKIVDASGRIINKEQLSRSLSQHSINVSSYESGIYYISIISEREYFRSSFVKI